MRYIKSNLFQRKQRCTLCIYICLVVDMAINKEIKPYKLYKEEISNSKLNFQAEKRLMKAAVSEGQKLFSEKLQRSTKFDHCRPVILYFLQSFTSVFA